ncbi:hypothetical protein [Vibrio scophthalmi]|uniref:Type I restriction-modification system methyltransferase subunit n=1 Tax=Vibrio scophthalmi LMG 19158 TaxID=870967 RepID=F9RIA3_9VIBR|nr:hypothetical protein [Vibrio scophthalmi]EGU42435.1 type I restriction-modification system methyltransferase subunit [Vibrio scophthalmi LMG 19158]
MTFKNVTENQTQSYTPNSNLFDLGSVFITQGINQLLSSAYLSPVFLNPCLFRHMGGDWGCICDDDKRCNDEATKTGDRILSEYLFSGQRIWIITEADRSMTTVMLPSEY